MQLIKYCIGISSIMLLASCNVKKQSSKSEDNIALAQKNKKDKDCPEDLICTMDYRMITVKIADKNTQTTKALDSTIATLADNPRVTLKTTSGQDVQSGFGEGVYIIAEDGNMSQVIKSGSKVTFKGFINGEVVVKGDYVIGHDCCHIQLISGPKELSFYP